MKLKFLSFFKSEPRAKDEYWLGLEVDKALHRNGNITERAKTEGRSLSYIERNIVTAVRDVARSRGISQQMINMVEMEGQQNKDLVYEPIKVKVKFAYYNSGEYGWDPQPSYHITESNHPALPVHGNVGREELEKNNIKVPSTPTYDKWVADGRKVFRG